MKKQPSYKAFLLLGALLYVLGTAIFTLSYSVGTNYRNVSIDTTVNITNSLPEVISVRIDAGATNITLNAGTYRNITCNTTVRDYNGGSTISNITATFFYNVSPTNSSSADDNNTHYTDANCTLGSFDTYTRNATCNFLVQYYANSGFWVCNVTAQDSYNYTNSTGRSSANNRTHLDALLALNVTALIDYGELSVGDLSSAQQANVTNFGNRNINVSVKGYGANITDGLAMVCDFGNISVQYEKYNLVGGSDLSTYRNLSAAHVHIPGLTISQQTNDSQQSINTTYWVLFVPPNPFGRCNGTIVFQAESST
jgi:hypothetical protein